MRALMVTWLIVFAGCHEPADVQPPNVDQQQIEMIMEEGKRQREVESGGRPEQFAR
jgi:hypothetical protein